MWLLGELVWHRLHRLRALISAMKAQVFTAMLLCFAVLGCFNRGERVIAKVGDVEITEEDLLLRKTVYEKCYKNPSKDGAEVLAELIRDALELAVLEDAFGVSPPEDALRRKARWIDRNTKDPKTLGCIKSVYRGRRAAYLRNVVRPTLVNPKLHGLFSRDTLIHKSERKSIAKILMKIIESPESLSASAGYDTFRVLRVRGGKVLRHGLEFRQDPIIDSVLARLKPGQVWRNVVEDDYSYRVVRLLWFDDTSYTYDGVVVKKKDFDEWFREYATSHVEIEIYDTLLRREFVRRYPDLWWLELLRD